MAPLTAHYEVEFDLLPHEHADGHAPHPSRSEEAVAAAFLGVLIGKQVMEKITLATLHKVVGILLILTGAVLAQV